MEANEGGGGLEDGEDHAPANGGGEHAPANGGGGHAPANGGGGHALYVAFLCLPTQEIARCRRVCRLWRDITGTEAFRLDHHRHPCRRPMPLVVFPAPRLDRYIIDAADTRDRVTRPVFRFPFNRGDLQIHGSCVGILLLSVNNRLYACNPCTRRWARLPPLHLSRRIIGFYATGVAGFRCQVLYADLHEPDCRYWILELEANPEARFIDRPGPADALRRANAIAPSHRNPPVYFLDFLCWLTRDGPSTSNILMFDTFDESFSLMPPPPNIRLDGAQLFEMHEHLAIALFSPARVDVWVRDNDSTLWSCMYRISVPVDPNVARPPGVYAVARDRNRLVQSPYILLSNHRIFRPRHTIEESLLLHPSILPFQDTDAVDGDPPFFGNQ